MVTEVSLRRFFRGRNVGIAVLAILLGGLALFIYTLAMALRALQF